VSHVEAQTVKLNPSSISIDQNTNFSLSLDISSVTDLFNVIFDIDFDPSVISFVNVVEGDFLSNNCKTFIMAEKRSPGKIIINLSKLGGLCDGTSGSGNLMTLNFKSLGISGTSNLTFSNNWLDIASNSAFPNLIKGTWVPTIVSVNNISAPVCTSFTYSPWSSCQFNNTKTRTVTSSFPQGCTAGLPIVKESCTYILPFIFISDLDGNGVVNTIDWSIMNTNWDTLNTAADLNKDGTVNTVDWSIMNREWNI